MREVGSIFLGESGNLGGKWKLTKFKLHTLLWLILGEVEWSISAKKLLRFLKMGVAFRSFCYYN